MALKTYSIDSFKGIDQSVSENKMDPAYSPDALNMDCRKGDLQVYHGYGQAFPSPVPGEEFICALYIWKKSGVLLPVVATAAHVYALKSDWQLIYSCNEPTLVWDFQEARIGNGDYLLIANGNGIIKWDGEHTAESFGSGSFVFSSTIESLHYNAEKAVNAVYSEDTENRVGTITLSMRSGYTPVATAHIAFVMPANMGSITSLKLVIGSTAYDFSYVPIWSNGDTVMVELGSGSAEPLDSEVYGIDRITIVQEMDEGVKTAALHIKGLLIGETAYLLEEINGRELVFEKAVTEELTVGATVQVRGGVSNEPVSFIELYYSRLFAAGDRDHPARLYWSQPPGDYRSIEDWSMDEYTASASGGHTDIGVASDPIVGLCAMSNQLLIFKESSIYRLLGDRPDNYRVVPVATDTDSTVNSARVSYRNIPYWMTKGGLYIHDGQSSGLMSNAKAIRDILLSGDFSTCKAAQADDRLFFSLSMGHRGYDDGIIVYDLQERSYMLLSGFQVAGLCAGGGELYMVDGKRYLQRWEESADSFDGEPIVAYWKTPRTDLGAKAISKTLKDVYFRGEGGVIRFGYRAGDSAISERFQMPEDDGTVFRFKLNNKGKVLSFSFENEAGSRFKLLGGMEIRFETTED